MLKKTLIANRGGLAEGMSALQTRAAVKARKSD